MSSSFLSNLAGKTSASASAPASRASARLAEPYYGLEETSMLCARFLSLLPVRGLTIGGLNIWIVVGQLLSRIIIKVCGGRSDAYAWKIPMGVQWSVPAFMLIALPFVPESPWHLVRRNKFDDARKALVRVYWLSGDDFEQHLARVKDVVDLESHNKEDGTYVDLFRGTKRIRSTIVAMTYICHGVVGVQFVLGFSTYFFQLAGFPVEQSFQLGIGALACGFVRNLLGLMFINRIGRRPLFLACTLDCLGLAICSLIPGQGALWGQAAFTVIYIFVFEAGISPVAYALNGELGSAKLRSKTIGWGTCVNSFWIGVLVVIMPYLVNPNEADLKGKVGWIFAGSGVIGSVWAYFFIPETAGRNIDELDELFNSRIPLRKFHKTVLDLDRSATYSARA